jgi:hypothetical protein
MEERQELQAGTISDTGETIEVPNPQKALEAISYLEKYFITTSEHEALPYVDLIAGYIERHLNFVQ